MVDAADLKSATSWRCVGSSPSLGTKISIKADYKLKGSINNRRIDRIEPILLDKCWTNSQLPTAKGLTPHHQAP